MGDSPDQLPMWAPHNVDSPDYRGSYAAVSIPKYVGAS
jgi:hypothetical protein